MYLVFLLNIDLFLLKQKKYVIQEIDKKKIIQVPRRRVMEKTYFHVSIFVSLRLRSKKLLSVTEIILSY